MRGRGPGSSVRAGLAWLCRFLAIAFRPGLGQTGGTGSVWPLLRGLRRRLKPGGGTPASGLAKAGTAPVLFLRDAAIAVSTAHSGRSGRRFPIPLAATPRAAARETAVGADEAPSSPEVCVLVCSSGPAPPVGGSSCGWVSSAGSAFCKGTAAGGRRRRRRRRRGRWGSPSSEDEPGRSGLFGAVAGRLQPALRSLSLEWRNARGIVGRIRHWAFPWAALSFPNTVPRRLRCGDVNRTKPGSEPMMQGRGHT